MRIPTPNPQLSHVQCEVLLENGEKIVTKSGGGPYVDIDDRAVEALIRSYNRQGVSADCAWTKEDGVHPVALYMKNKEAKKKLAAYEDRQKRQARSKKIEDVPPSKELPKSKSED